MRQITLALPGLWYSECNSINYCVPLIRRRNFQPEWPITKTDEWIETLNYSAWNRNSQSQILMMERLLHLEKQEYNQDAMITKIFGSWTLAWRCDDGRQAPKLWLPLSWWRTKLNWVEWRNIKNYNLLGGQSSLRQGFFMEVSKCLFDDQYAVNSADNCFKLLKETWWYAEWRLS